MDKIRVLVVEDSLTIRSHMVEIFEASPDFEVVGEASDGKTAFELCRRLRPSVVTMDMMLDGSSGLFATEQIMAFCPTPILIVSASTNRGELFRTYDALKAGAVDVLEKPLGVEPSDAWADQLKKTLRLISRIRVITHPRAKLTLTSQGPAAPSSSRWEVVAIGASTGGPSAAIEVLRALPADFPLPILLVIHISGAFASALAEWLATQLALPVRHAREGEPLPRSGCVLMPPPDRHLEVRGGRVSLGDGPEVNFCRPSVDVLFDSLARNLGARTLACLLTGMGRDGASGLLAIKNSGGLTIAQDETTSVVFGMPAEAVRLGAAEHVLPLHEIGPRIAREVA